jgi:uncharacterized protein (UPF0332 family)
MELEQGLSFRKHSGVHAAFGKHFAKTEERQLHGSDPIPMQGVEAKAKATYRFLKQKMAEYETLKEEIEQLQQEVKQGTSSGS